MERCPKILETNLKEDQITQLIKLSQHYDEEISRIKHYCPRAEMPISKLKTISTKFYSICHFLDKRFYKIINEEHFKTYSSFKDYFLSSLDTQKKDTYVCQYKVEMKS